MVGDEGSGTGGAAGGSAGGRGGASRPPVLPERRQATVDALCEHFANDTLGVEEFERRVEGVHRARDEEELRRLLSDLPDLDRPLPTRGRARKEREEPRRERQALARPVQASPDQVRDHEFVGAILGGADRKGRWIPARNSWVVAVCGGAEIDLREAVFPPGVTEIRIFAFWGGVDVIVPPNVEVDVSGAALLAGFGIEGEMEGEPPPGGPLIRVTGVAVMAGVDVRCRYPGESSRDARRRRTEVRKEQRRLGRGG